LIESTAAYTLADKDDNVVVKGAKYTLGTAVHLAEATIALVELVVANVLLGTAKTAQFFLPKQRSEWFNQKVLEPLSQHSLDTTVGMLKAASRMVTNFTSKDTREAAEKDIESRVSSMYDSDTAQAIKNFHINGWTPKKESTVCSLKSEKQVEGPIQQQDQEEDWPPVKEKIAQQIEEGVSQAAIKKSKPTSNEPVKTVKVTEKVDPEETTRVDTEETSYETFQGSAPQTNSRKYACIAAGLVLIAGIVGYAIYNGYGPSTPLQREEVLGQSPLNMTDFMYRMGQTRSDTVSELGQCAECVVGKFGAPVASAAETLGQCAWNATDLTKDVFGQGAAVVANTTEALGQCAANVTHCGESVVGKFAAPVASAAETLGQCAWNATDLTKDVFGQGAAVVANTTEALGQCAANVTHCGESVVGKFGAPVASAAETLGQCAWNATDLTKDVFGQGAAVVANTTEALGQCAANVTHCAECVVGKFAAPVANTLSTDLFEWGRGLVRSSTDLVVYNPNAFQTCAASIEKTGMNYIGGSQALSNSDTSAFTNKLIAGGVALGTTGLAATAYVFYSVKQSMENLTKAMAEGAWRAERASAKRKTTSSN